MSDLSLNLNIDEILANVDVDQLDEQARAYLIAQGLIPGDTTTTSGDTQSTDGGFPSNDDDLTIPTDDGYGGSTPTTPPEDDTNAEDPLANLSQEQIEYLTSIGLIDAGGNLITDLSNIDIDPFTGDFNINITPPNPEDAINQRTEDLFDRSMDAFESLQAFQTEQRDYAQGLLDRIQSFQALSIPSAPDRAGTFVAAGAAREQRPVGDRIGLADLNLSF